MSGTSGPVDFVFNSRCLLSAASEPHRRSFFISIDKRKYPRPNNVHV